MTVLLFYTFNVGVFMILLNMFLAIVADSYAEVKGNQSKEDIQFYFALADQVRAFFSPNPQVDFSNPRLVTRLDST
eukprot:762960-Prorocentrum_minimum.AAC.2